MIYSHPTELREPQNRGRKGLSASGEDPLSFQSQQKELYLPLQRDQTRIEAKL
uniref:Uncharacterized protein n=2 Tax=Picea TaxID=3328 RepID=A0A101M587_PICGL|nr:hypothetical protein ABT39_MTgene968 [Picea glauca]QHR91394.1 hypothetical protein Q903MT_gene5428 [Picea sitchensis]